MALFCADQSLLSPLLIRLHTFLSPLVIQVVKATQRSADKG